MRRSSVNKTHNRATIIFLGGYTCPGAYNFAPKLATILIRLDVGKVPNELLVARRADHEYLWRVAAALAVLVKEFTFPALLVSFAHAAPHFLNKIIAQPEISSRDSCRGYISLN